jgi:hypothetical protein
MLSFGGALQAIQERTVDLLRQYALAAVAGVLSHLSRSGFVLEAVAGE